MAFVVVFALLFISNLQAIISETQVPCFFIFGDSLVDNGNNNALPTKAKANYPPYGVDFPGGPTGRFTNGRNTADILAQILGFDNFIPPFADYSKGLDITKGINYGSGSAGIRDETGMQLGSRFTFNMQLRNHQLTLLRLSDLLGNKSAAKEHLSKCLYTVGIGNNDYINNYLKPEFYRTSRLYTPDQFAAVLIGQFSQQLSTLYSYGARKIALFGLGFIGCIPAELAVHGNKRSPCVDSINIAVQLFNNRLKPLVDDLNSKLSGAKFTFINITSISSGDPSAVGIKFVNKPCCEASAIASGQCVPDKTPCSNRTEYVFYDDFHPTEIVNLGTASRAYKAQLQSDAYPHDISSLVQL